MKNTAYKTIKLCPCCIEAIKSRGERLFVGDYLEFTLDPEELICEWCGEEDEEVRECHF